MTIEELGEFVRDVTLEDDCSIFEINWGFEYKKEWLNCAIGSEDYDGFVARISATSDSLDAALEELRDKWREKHKD